MQEKGKVLYIKPKAANQFRLKRKSWNYFQTLFFISFTFNILFFMLLMLKK